ncbi:MAG TPA: hypothetical protein VK534_00790 [Methylomirabilota bacterium]|nr:hypothetical protein [Methylomirabilota bacterium]
MFGHQDDDSSNNDEHNQAHEEPAHSGESPSETEVITPTADTGSTPEATEPAEGQDDWQHPGDPIKDEDKEDKNGPISDILSPAGGFPRSSDTQASNHGPSDPSSDDTIITDTSNHELIEIKQHSLEELEPLVDNLDLAPEEKFRTVMMIIQASDKQDLIKKAYEAAKAIEDEKTRAQALLDIVNEINFFTSQHEA